LNHVHFGKNEVQTLSAFVVSFNALPSFPAFRFCLFLLLQILVNRGYHAQRVGEASPGWFSCIAQLQIPFNPFEAGDLERCLFWTLYDHPMIEPLVLNSFGCGWLFSTDSKIENSMISPLAARDWNARYRS
jgi:hypothetical protein